MKQKAKIWYPKPTGQQYKDSTGPTWYETLSDQDKERIKTARRIADRKAAAQDKFLHSFGYCPYCGMLRCTNGKCPNGCED